MLKYLAVGVMFLFVFMFSLSYYDAVHFADDEENKITCDNWGVMYLTESEMDKTEEVVNTVGAAYFPELDRIVFSGELKECDNFNPFNYIKMNGGNK